MSTKGSARRPRIRDAAISLTAMAAVIATIALIDERVREAGAGLAAGNGAAGLGAAGARAESAGWTVVTTVRGLELEQMSLALFVIVATVLVIAMLRT